MPYVIRQGDLTTTGGFVLEASGNEAIELLPIARMGDPVWCPACRQVGYIAQGNPTWIDEQVAVATNGHRVKCGCKAGKNCVISSQEHFQADMEAAICIPDDMAETAKAHAEQMTQALKDGTFNPTIFRILPAQNLG